MNTKSDKQIFTSMFRYMKPYFPLYIVGLILYSSQAFAIPFINGLAMASVTEGILAADFSIVMQAIVIMAVQLVGYMLVLAGGVYFYVMSSQYAMRDLLGKITASFIKSDNKNHTGEGIATINTDARTATSVYDNALAPVLSMTMAVVLSAVAIFRVDWRLGLGIIALGAVIFVAQAFFAKPLGALGKAQLETNASAVKEISNHFQGALTIRAFNRQQFTMMPFTVENGQLKKIAFGRAWISMWQNLLTTVQGWLVLLLVFGLGGWLVASGHIYFPQLMLVLSMAEVVGSSMSGIGAAYAGLKPPIVAARRVLDIVESGAHNTPDYPVFDWDKDTTIRLGKLNFSYSDYHALRDISMTVEKNQTVAIVGPSGSGKSTLLRAMIGMYEHGVTGELSMGNMPYKNPNQWRQNFAYVDQSAKLFDMSIGENIALGDVGNKSEAAIKDAAARAFIADFIDSLPEKYDSPCGEQGTSLSGGQKQRIAIARALYRKAPILVFDEATSALDMDSERHIIETIESLRHDHTILLTTHNLNNVKNADKIIVMDQGQIAQTGTHAQLIGQTGIYKNLWEEQGGQDGI